LILDLYDDPAVEGRKGTLRLEKAIKLIKKKIEERNKFEKFAAKYADKADREAIKVPGTSYSSFKDLI